MSELGILLGINLVFLVLTLGVGLLASRGRRSSPEEYFLAGRSARTVVLFMALYGTNVTPFVLMGIPGLAYHLGVGVFGMNAAIVVLGIPLSFYLIGYPAWIAAKRTGAITPAELYARRFSSPTVGVVLFLAFFAYTIPYIVTTVLGAGLAVESFTGGAVSLAAAAATVLLITIAYTTFGGMRATMWTNVFQGATFLAFVVAAFFIVADGLGGLAAATERVARVAPELLVRGEKPDFARGAWGSWALAISLTVIAFPHMLVRIFAARDAAALKNACRLYPLASLLLWFPVVMIGVWGAAEVPGLVGKESDRIFPLMIARHVGPVVQALGMAGIVAAVMSTLDAQLLTLSSMLTRDVLRRIWPSLDDRLEVRVGRLFVLLLAMVAYGLVMARPASIFAIATFSFSGYVTLIPTLFLGLRWRRFTAAGAVASIVAGNLALLAAFAAPSPPLGLLPVAWGLAAAIVAGVGVSWFSSPAPEEATNEVVGSVLAALRTGS